MEAIRSILFDFGNVIIDIDIPGAENRLGGLRADSISVDKFRRELTALVHKYEVGAISTDIFINGILKHSDRSVQARDVIEAWNSMLVGIPEYRFSMLEKLKENFSVNLLSNTNELHLNWIYDYLENTHGISDFDQRFFDSTYYSHLIGQRKPDSSAFDHVARESFLDPNKTLFIDDNAANIESATSLGYQTHLSPPYEEIAEVLKVRGLY